VAKAQSKLSEMKQTGGDLKSQNETFNYIMNHLKKKKIVDGIIGRLGDLGGIPKKFDVALSSSCNMNVIVVEKTTQEWIKTFLIEMNLKIF
jgi:chromosome segregation ATPase